VKQTTAGFNGIFEVRWADFLGIEVEKGDPFDAHCRAVFCVFHAVVVIPMAAKGCFARGWASQ
jgi:hypothetical protein